MPDQIRETAGTILEAAKGASPNTYPVLLISEGKGSSGYYPASTLQEAARSRVIPAGTFSFIDHPSATDAMDRPERSVRDLAAVTTTDAVWSDEHNGLVAEMRVFAPYQPLISEVGKHIGLSILGDGDIEMREGQRTVTHLAHVNSVDWVTRAGRGGKVLERLLESARQPVAEARNVGHYIESRMHNDFTDHADRMFGDGHLSRDERIHLSNAVGHGLSAFSAHLEANAPQLYQRDIYDEPAAPAVSEGAPAPTPPIEENLMPQIEEARLGQLEEAAGRVPTLEAERDAAAQRAEQAEARLAAFEARQAARPAVAAAVAESAVLGARAQARVVESVLAALPVVDGTIAEDARTAAVTAAVEAAEAEAAEYGRPVREGLVGAFGSRQTREKAEVAEADAIKSYDALSAGVFGRTVKGN